MAGKAVYGGWGCMHSSLGRQGQTNMKLQGDGEGVLGPKKSTTC